MCPGEYQCVRGVYSCVLCVRERCLSCVQVRCVSVCVCERERCLFVCPGEVCVRGVYLCVQVRCVSVCVCVCVCV